MSVLLDNSTDTIRGGSEVVFSGDALLDTSSDITFRSGYAGWSPSVTGAGTVTASTAGAVLDSGGTGTAALVSTATYVRGDFEVTGVRVLPVRATEGREIVVLALGTARVGVRYSRGSLVAFGSAGSVVGGAEILGAGGTFALQLVRNAGRVFGFVNGTSVLDVSGFDVGALAVRISTGGGTAGTERVRVVASDFTIRSHATIDDRLVTDKVDVSARRFAGRVPAAELTDVGPVDVVTFGLFGQETLSDGFVYTLPPARTIAIAGSQVLSTVQDPVLFDGG